MSLNSEQVRKVVEEYQTSPGDTGSPEVQIALLTARIKDVERYKSLIQRLGLRR